MPIIVQNFYELIYCCWRVVIMYLDTLEQNAHCSKDLRKKGVKVKTVALLNAIQYIIVLFDAEINS